MKRRIFKFITVQIDDLKKESEGRLVNWRLCQRKIEDQEHQIDLLKNELESTKNRAKSDEINWNRQLSIRAERIDALEERYIILTNSVTNNGGMEPNEDIFDAAVRIIHDLRNKLDAAETDF